MHPDISGHMEKAVEKYFYGEAFREQVLEAKKIYFELTGMVNDRASDYEHRMQMFNDWFLFDYISDNRQIPYMTEYLNEGRDLSDGVKKALGNIVYSVFEFRKKSFSKNMVLKDFVSGEKYILSPEHFPFGILPGEVIVARVVDYEGSSFPLSGIRYIPKELKSIISKEAKKTKQLGNPSAERKFVLAIERFKSRCEQYTHIDPISVYKKFGFNK